MEEEKTVTSVTQPSSRIPSLKSRRRRASLTGEDDQESGSAMLEPPKMIVSTTRSPRVFHMIENTSN